MRPSREPRACSRACSCRRSAWTTRSGCSRCPALVGADPATGEEITAQNGRYGPYLKKGTDSRSLAGEDQIFDITLDEALAVYAQPKARGRAAASAPLRELGADPVSGSPVVVKDGRFGAYVTDGTTNATLRKEDTVEAITLERAAELLADKRGRAPAAKRGARKTAAKKAAPAKTATAKTTTAKTAKTAQDGQGWHEVHQGSEPEAGSVLATGLHRATLASYR